MEGFHDHNRYSTFVWGDWALCLAGASQRVKTCGLGVPFGNDLLNCLLVEISGFLPQNSAVSMRLLQNFIRQRMEPAEDTGFLTALFRESPSSAAPLAPATFNLKDYPQARLVVLSFSKKGTWRAQGSTLGHTKELLKHKDFDGIDWGKNKWQGISREQKHPKDQNTWGWNISIPAVQEKNKTPLFYKPGISPETEPFEIGWDSKCSGKRIFIMFWELACASFVRIYRR